MVIDLLGQGDGMSRGQLAEATGLTTAAISRITREMLDVGFLREGEPIPAAGRVGRRESLLAINPEGAYVLAISMTANRRNVTLANACGEVISSLPCDDIDFSAPMPFLAEVASRAKSLVYDADFNRGRLLGAGVSAAVSVSLSSASPDELVTSNPLGWRDVPVRQTLADALGLPVRVEHRASAILRGEINRREDASDIFLINCALGMGVSAFINGRFFAEGENGLGSLSHLAVPGCETPCVCGRHGCLETVATGYAVVDMLGHADLPTPLQAKLLERAATEGDDAARAAFAKAGAKMAFGVEAVFAVLNPKRIVFSGEVGRQPDFQAGLADALRAMGCADACDKLERSSTTSTEAAISVALREYVFSVGLDLKQLMAS